MFRFLQAFSIRGAYRPVLEDTLTKNERQKRIATADIALLVLDSNGSFVERWLELRSCIFVYRSLNFFSTTYRLVFVDSIFTFLFIHTCTCIFVCYSGRTPYIKKSKRYFVDKDRFHQYAKYGTVHSRELEPTKNERQKRIATADIALLVPDSNGSFVERWLELRSCIFVYRSLNFFSTT